MLGFCSLVPFFFLLSKKLCQTVIKATLQIDFLRGK
jgi:hypothetical protein